MAKVVWTFGIIAGVILAVMMVITLGGGEIDFDTGRVTGYLTMIISLSTIFFAIRSHRDKHLNGIISFGKAFRMGFWVSLIASTMYVTTWMVISHGKDAEFLAGYKEHTIEKARLSGDSEETIEEMSREMDEMAELYNNPAFKFGFTYVEVLPVGLLISLISAGILKTKKKME